ERGGGLLCLGDHTGVAGIRGPFNDLLAPLGIRFQFDSATFFGDGWEHALEVRNHPMNRGLGDAAADYSIWVGASLDLDRDATPVVVARYGYSDHGDMSNLRMGFLGDRRYNPDELLGDVVLVGETRYGDGKVLVFGDTSTYQNLALSQSWNLVLRSVDHLASRGGMGLGARTQWAMFWLLLIGIGVVSSGGRRAAPVAAVAFGLWLGSASLALATGRAPQHPLDWSKARPVSLEAAGSNVTPSRVALLDWSHGGHYDMKAWYDRSVGGLLLNLTRTGFFPI